MPTCQCIRGWIYIEHTHTQFVCFGTRDTSICLLEALHSFEGLVWANVRLERGIQFVAMADSYIKLKLNLLINLLIPLCLLLVILGFVLVLLHLIDSYY